MLDFVQIPLTWAHSAAYCCDNNSNTMLWAAASQCERERETKWAQVATHKQRTNDKRTNESSTKTAAAQQQRHQTGWQQSRRHEMLRRFSNGQPFARWTTKPTQTAKPKPTLTANRVTKWRLSVRVCVCVRTYVYRARARVPTHSCTCLVLQILLLFFFGDSRARARVAQHWQPPQHAVVKTKRNSTHTEPQKQRSSSSSNSDGTLLLSVVILLLLLLVILASQDTRSEDAKREQKTEQRWQLTELHRSALQNNQR